MLRPLRLRQLMEMLQYWWKQVNRAFEPMRPPLRYLKMATPHALVPGVLALVLSLALLQLVLSDQATVVDVQHGACVLHDAPARVDLWSCTESLAQGAEGRTEQILLDVQSDEALERVFSAHVDKAHWLRLSHRPSGRVDWQLALAVTPGQSFFQRSVLASKVAAPLRLEPGLNELRLEYRINADGRVQPRLYSPVAWLEFQLQDALSTGLMLGALLMLIGILLVQAWVLHQPAFLAYAGLVGSYALFLFDVSGYGFALVWPNSPNWNQVAPFAFGGIAVICHLLFIMQFFQMQTRYPGLWRACGVHALITSVQVMACLAGMMIWSGEDLARWFSYSMACAALIYGLLASITSLRALRDNMAGAQNYLIGMLVLAIFNPGFFVLSAAGHNPFPGVDFFLYPKLGLIIELVFSTTALLERLRQFKTWQAEARRQQWREAEALLAADLARQRAQEEAHRKSLELASASHDMAQPLASLRMVVEALRNRPGNEHEATHLDRTLDHAQDLLRSLLKRERGAHRAADPPILLGTLLEQVAQELQATASQKGIRLRSVACHARIKVSQHLLLRVVRNLASNAVRYTRSGRVVLGVRRRTDGLEIQVLDTGPGMPLHLVTALQQPYHQGDNASPDGYGLGLFIVSALCQRAGWHFSMSSTEGRGTCMRVLLPFSIQPPAAAP